MRLVAVLAAALLSLAAPSFSKDAAPAPDLSRMLALQARFTMFSGCPVAATRALTSAHAVDLRPFDRSVPLYGARYQTWDGSAAGRIRPIVVSMEEDIALVAAEGLTPYPIATEMPATGEQLWWVGYDYRKRKDALAPRVFTGRVIRGVAGVIVIDVMTEEGTSGGCALNARGEAVGIIDFGLGIGDRDAVTGVVAIFGPWLDNFRKLEDWR